MFELFHHKQPITLAKRDIHNHLLPGVDDGFRSADDSIRAIQKMVQHKLVDVLGCNGKA